MALKPINANLSPASSDLGLGDMLGQQVKDETEEERKKRMLQQQSGLANSPATMALFGGLGGSG